MEVLMRKLTALTLLLASVAPSAIAQNAAQPQVPLSVENYEVPQVQSELTPPAPVQVLPAEPAYQYTPYKSTPFSAHLPMR